MGEQKFLSISLQDYFDPYNDGEDNWAEDNDSDGGDEKEQEYASTLFIAARKKFESMNAAAHTPDGELGDTLRGGVLDVYDRMGHHDRVEKVFGEGTTLPRGPLVDAPALEKVFSYASAAGGASLSRT